MAGRQFVLQWPAEGSQPISGEAIRDGPLQSAGRLGLARQLSAVPSEKNTIRIGRMSPE